MTQTTHDRGSKYEYVSVSFTPGFRALIEQVYPQGDVDCRHAVHDADSWAPHLTAQGIAFTADLPHAALLCAHDAELSFARLAPYFTADGQRAAAAFASEMRAALAKTKD